MFVDKHSVSELGYIALLLVFNTSRAEGYTAGFQSVVDQLSKVASRSEVLQTLEDLAGLGLLYPLDANFEQVREFAKDGSIVLSWLGVAFLVNHANEYAHAIQKKRNELPEKLLASLVPYLNLKLVPAADRYVDVNDNKPDFQALVRELEVIRDEIARDENKNEYPIPEKRAVVAELDGVLAQLHRGYVRLSTLTTQVRPLLHEIAGTCKDIPIIAGAATAALWAIQGILAKMM